MSYFQKILIVVYGVMSFLCCLKGFNECYKKKNAFGETPLLYPFGMFVWGDTVVFGIFWILVTVVVLLLNDWVLFLLIVSIFWVVRSLGESIYWINQQFSKLNRNPPEKFWFYKYFKNDSVHYVNQIFWQCVTVISIVFTIYFAKMWLLK